MPDNLLYQSMVLAIHNLSHLAPIPPSQESWQPVRPSDSPQKLPHLQVLHQCYLFFV